MPVMHHTDILCDMSTTLLRRGIKVRFHAKGQSMQPTIRDGEVLTVVPIAPSDVQRRDIILYRTLRGLIAHRVVGITRHPGQAITFTLRGDALGACDAPVQTDQLLGKVVSVTRGDDQIDVSSRRATRWHLLRVWASHLLRRITARFSCCHKN